MKNETMKNLIERHAAAEGFTETPIEGLQLFRISEPIERLPSVYPPSVCAVVQGRKHAYLDGQRYVYDPSHYICGTMPFPVQAEAPFATKEEPILGMMLSLETRAMAEIVVEYEATADPLRESPGVELTPGLMVVKWDDVFETALYQMLALLDDPVAARLLGKGRLRELLFAVIRGEAGALVRRSFGHSHDLTRALNYLRDNLNENLSVDDLAQKAGMSRAVFHRRFKAATTYSPLQFIKALRLSDAAMMIAQGMNVSEAADTVGYTSASQFSREFRRHFGHTPRAWGKIAATSGTDVQAII